MRFFCATILGVLLVLNCFQNNVACVDKILSNNCIEISDCEFEIVDGDYLKILDDLNVSLINEFYIEDRLIIEGYSNSISDYIVIDNSRINIQISISSDNCIFGIPLIKNSF